ncbi:hypothetical protein ACFQV8_17610 [Pseudonocardia benzenivorans]
MDAVGQAELVREGEVTSEELARAAISRIEALNPRINAVIHYMFDEGLAAARRPRRRLLRPGRSTASRSC